MVIPDKQKRIAAATAIATAIAIPAEGLRQYAYYDPPGILTVCYGSTTNVEKNKKYSFEECKARLEKDMLNAIKQVEQCHSGLPTEVLAAFGDAVYNVGPTVVCNSTASRFLSISDYKGACNQLPRWNKAKIMGIYIELPGLTKRRNKEKEICLLGT